MVLQFHFTFKPFPSHAQKRERARERKSSATKIERSPKASIAPQGKPSSPRSSKALITEIVCRDHQDRVKHRADRDLAFASIAIAWTIDCDHTKHRANRSPSSNPENVCVSVFDRNVCVSVVWQPRKCEKMWPDLMIFFWVLFVFCIEEWMILYIRLATEKMWENVSNK